MILHCSLKASYQWNGLLQKVWWRTGVTFITGNMPLHKSRSLGLQLHCWSRAHWLKRWIFHSSQFSPYLSTFTLSWKLWRIDAKTQTQFATISMCETMRYFYYSLSCLQWSNVKHALSNQKIRIITPRHRSAEALVHKTLQDLEALDS